MNSGKQATGQKTAISATDEIAAHLSLFREINNLKRIRAAHLPDSFAADLFRRAWGKINGGDSARSVALEIVTDAVIGAQLGAIDAPVLQSAELRDEEIETILNRAFESFAAPIDADLRDELQTRIATPHGAVELKVPSFVECLARQPRSGATKVGAPKLIFDQPENHAEHCIIVGVFGCLLAPFYRADIETVFFAALAHHFHNAYLPDSGFAGEESLGEFLPRIFEAFRAKCLAEIPENLHAKIRRALEIIETADAPEAKAFHAADVIDRVLQMRHHAEANEFTLKYAMEEAELVHAGAIQAFHYEVLRAAKLIENI